MPTVTVEARVPDADPDDVFARLRAFEQYAQHTDAVREVTVTNGADGTVTSDWSVNFRQGVLCWSEQDEIDAVARSIAFEQVDGDFEDFRGSWRVSGAGADATVRFVATFDLGMPSLADLIDPIAARALDDNIRAILRGLLSPHLAFVDAPGRAVPARAGPAEAVGPG